MKLKRNLAFILPLFTFIFVFCGLLVRNIRLSSLPFYDWDEALYAQIGSEILKNNSLFTTFNGQLWFDKPPLLHGLIASIFVILGRSEFWTRSLMIVFGMALLILLYLLTKQILESLFKDKIKKLNPFIKQVVYLLPVLITASTNLFVEKSLFLNTDIIIAVSWVGYFVYRESFPAKLFFLLLGVYAKSVFGFYPLLLEAFTLKRKDLKSKNILQFAFLIIISSLWYVINYIKFGNFFIKAHFLDQVFKRIIVPIELHFGGKFYYFEFLWNNLSFILILLVLGYIILSIEVLRFISKEKFTVTKSKKWWFYIVLLSPFPFFFFITLIKTKLYWYLTMLIPLFALVASYLFVKLENKIVRSIIFVAIFAYFLFNFLPQTYSLKADVSISDKVALAKCLSGQPGKNIAFMTEIQERKNQNFLEAAHYDTTASFYYGGSPSFVYYSQKEISFFYNVDKFINEFSNYDIVVLPAESLTADLKIKDSAEIRKSLIDAEKRNYCRTRTWVAFPK